MKVVEIDLQEVYITTIFNALGDLPFNQVFELIGELNKQVNCQYKKGISNYSVKININQLKIIIKALSKLSFSDSYPVIKSIETQVKNSLTEKEIFTDE